MAKGSSGYDKYITIFSPEGKLFQVEYAFRAVKNCAMTAFGIKGENAAALVVQKKTAMSHIQQDKLIDTNYVTSLHSVTDSIGGAFVGLPADCKSIVFRARDEAGKFSHEKGYAIPVHHLTSKISGINQIYTQHAYMRLCACTGIFIAIDDESGPSVFKFDPAGFHVGTKACAVGAKEQEGMNAFEKIVKRQENLKTDDAVIRAAIHCYQEVISKEAKAEDMEIAVVTTADPKFRKLTKDEIDDHLNAMEEES